MLCYTGKFKLERPHKSDNTQKINFFRERYVKKRKSTFGRWTLGRSQARPPPRLHLPCCCSQVPNPPRFLINPSFPISFARCRPLPSANEKQLLDAAKCPQLLPYLDATRSGSFLTLISPLLPCSLAELRLSSPGLSTMQVLVAFFPDGNLPLLITKSRCAGS